jgi:hypothetical protein
MQLVAKAFFCEALAGIVARAVGEAAREAH